MNSSSTVVGWEDKTDEGTTIHGRVCCCHRLQFDVASRVEGYFIDNICFFFLSFLSLLSSGSEVDVEPRTEAKKTQDNIFSLSKSYFGKKRAKRMNCSSTSIHIQMISKQWSSRNKIRVRNL